ncbi:methylenetetrahydrofolate reductase [Arthrobacter yangruifuii]|uniref:Methylenetetrahydrofolate reductase n=1 Tax=Arthrobacter yangruifuii TaxID=2606616 RepID=A0A5N6MFA2_9MICC|nr:methylenetetrahydrofolate reductase [Arthrobacter yangruifuii]KAD3515101.1 methylenetetrahydrofolate reductase [Arthrobacter yangruifuii]
MTEDSTETPAPSAPLLTGFSLEMTGKDIGALQEAQPSIPPATRINVTFLGNEDLPMRVAAAAAVRAGGLVPVPHISARRLQSREDLGKFLESLEEVEATEELFVVGGDPVSPLGPYPDALSVIRSGMLPGHGVRAVSISGYPEGHPDIDADTLWTALQDKISALDENGLDASITTQFGFDVAPVLAWLEELRSRGVTAPVRIGVPGPAGVKRLLGYARRFGVSSSAGIAHKYGFSLTNLLGTAGPDRFIQDLAQALSPAVHGDVRLHFYTFGGIKTTADWIRNYQG